MLSSPWHIAEPKKRSENDKHFVYKQKIPALLHFPAPLSLNCLHIHRTWFPQESHVPPYKRQRWAQTKRRDKLMITLLKPRAWRNQSLTLLSVDVLVKSKRKRIACASLQTRGSIFTNSLCPPRSQMLNVIMVPRTETDFSMKFTPLRYIKHPSWLNSGSITKSLNVVFIKVAFDVFYH